MGAAANVRATAAHNPAKLKVFISYSRQDIAFVDRLQEALAAREIMAFVDRGHIEKGEEWWARIQQLITEADTIVFVLSPASVDSEVCGKEVEFAEELNKRFVPIVARDLEGRSIPAVLARLNYIFFTANPTVGASGDFDEAVEELVLALETNIAWIREHTRLGTLAERWEARRRPTDLLMRGAELRAAESWLTTRPEKAPDPTDAHRAFVTKSRQAASRRQRWVAGLSLAAAVIALGLAGVAFVQRQLAQENEARANTEREVAEEQKALAVSELKRAQISQSRYLTGYARDAINRGDYGSGALLTLEALPSPTDPDSRPFVDGVAETLRDALGKLREIMIIRGSDRIQAAAFSKHGRRVATASEDGTAALWDFTTGAKVATFNGHSSGVRNIAFSPDDKLIVTAGLDGARLWDASAGAERFKLTGGVEIRAVAFSPNGKVIGLACVDNVVRVFNVATGELAFELRGHESIVSDIRFSPDGSLIATVSSDDTLRIWDALDGRAIAVGKGHAGQVQSVEFSPDGSTIATASSDGTARIWNARTGSELFSLSGHTNYVWSARFSPDGKSIVTASQDQTARVWDVTSGQQSALLEGHEGTVVDARYSPDGQMIVTASIDATARLWNASTFTLIEVLKGHDRKVEDAVKTAIFSPDGKIVLTASDDGTARLWRAQADAGMKASEEEVRVLAHQVDSGMSYADYSPDGSKIATTSFSGPGWIWDVATAKEIASLAGHQGSVWRVRFNHDGKLLVTAAQDGAIIWDAETGAMRWLLKSEKDTRTAEFSPDGRLVLTSATDNTVRLWNATTGEEVARFEHDGVDGAAFSPDGQLAISASINGSARVWDVNAKKLHVELDHGADVSVMSAAFSPDGKLVATGSSDAQARIWEVATGREIHRLAGHQSGIRYVGFSRDGKVVLTGSSDETARLWDVVSGQQTAILKRDNNFSSAESIGTIWSADFSPDGLSVVTQPEDGPARVWEVATGSLLKTLEGHQHWVHSARFSPDGRHIVTASYDNTARIFPSPKNTIDLINESIDRLPRCLTSAQRERYFLTESEPDWCSEQSKWPFAPRRWGFDHVDTVQARKTKLQKFVGQVITRVVYGSPASVAGLAVDDVVTQANGKIITDSKSMDSAVDELGVGDSLQLRVIRDHREFTLEVRSRQRP